MESLLQILELEIIRAQNANNQLELDHLLVILDQLERRVNGLQQKIIVLTLIANSQREDDQS